MSGDRIAAIAAFAVVVAGVAVGFAAIGPPQHVRLIELDQRRVSDLESIESALRSEANGANVRASLPARGGDRWPRDPVTGQPYGYHRESATRYQVCATFALPAGDEARRSGWRHGAGRTCYRLDRSALQVDYLPLATSDQRY